MMKERRQDTRLMLSTLFFIYFFSGLAQCFETVFIPEFKAIFHLDYQHAMYVNTGKNVALVFSVIIGFLTRRLGFKNCLTIAMVLYAVGAALIVPGIDHVSFGLVIAAFSIVGLGFSFQLVAGNPMLNQLGNPATASSRLNLGNALGAVAWIVSPLLITVLIPAHVSDAADKIPYMRIMFLVIATVLGIIAVVTVIIPDVKVIGEQKSSVDVIDAKRAVWLNPKVLWGFVTIFMVLGVEAGTFSLVQNYLLDPNIIGLDERKTKLMFTIFFSIYALGRLTASWLQRKIKPEMNLILNAVLAILLLIVIITAKGSVALAAILTLGFFISIFFPTLYALTIEKMGVYTGQVSGLLTMGFLGCALIPVLQGRLADIPAVGLQKSFIIGILPYLLVLFYATKGRKLGRLNMISLQPE